MKADVKKDGKLFLAEVSDKLRDRLAKLAETLLAGQQEIENMHAYYWENYTEMDQYGYEDFDNQQALLHQINANNESQLLYQRFQKMADAPFFGRVDFLYDGDEEAEIFYIGIGNFAERTGAIPLIYDWRAPVSGLFYDYDKGPASYEAPGGTMEGAIEAKWQYKIQGGKMIYGFESDVKIDDEILAAELGSSGEVQLKNIIRTIQKEQNAIIRNTKDRILVIQGAAGSGKTAVLVERIISMISEGTHPLNIDQLLVMTFTNAAASEMRERIGAAVEKKLKEDPGNEHLWLQSALIPQAKIMTIDSFCLDLIRNHYNALDIDPAFRIGDEGELTLLKGDVMEQVLEECYETADDGFLQFSEQFGSGKSDKAMEDVILQAWTFSQSHPWPDQWLDQCRQQMEKEAEGDLDSSEWMRFLLRDISLQMGELAAQAEEALEVAREENGPFVYEPMLMNDVSRLKKIREAAASGSYEAFYHAVSELTFDRLAAARSKEIDPEKKAYVSDLRIRVKKAAEKCRDTYGSQSPEAAIEGIRNTRIVIQVLLDMVKRFDAAYTEAKRERNVLDFNDLEHLTLQVLTVEEEDGTRVPSQAAGELSGQYEEILVDEYQDSNLVQETLIQSISRERLGQPNVFMVGDVKQSIYRFRLARPELFMEKYKSYSTEEAQEQRIDLHKNFRSREQVLESVNFIFRQIMGEDLGGITYDKDAALYPGASFPEGESEEFVKTEVLLVERDGEELSDVQDYEDAGASGNRREMENQTGQELEALAIAQRIKEIVGKEQIVDKETKEYRPVEYGDIVILLRTAYGWAETFREVLASQGIPVYCTSRTGYFSATEIVTVLNYLKVCDNPLQDIPLMGVLRSPIVGCTSQELAELRIQYPDGLLYESVSAYAGENEIPEKELDPDKLKSELLNSNLRTDEKNSLNIKLKGFLSLLEKVRSMAAYTPVHELILYVLKETGYGDYARALPGGEQRFANLTMLVEKAMDYEKTSYRGLFNFVRYIEQLQAYQVDYGEVNLTGAGNTAVEIMTIHKSKGLEFPVVFVAGMGKQFNFQDMNAGLLLHPELGIGADAIIPEKRVIASSLNKQVIRRQLLKESLGEELRVLYVAMTRAKEKLILTGTVGKLEKQMLSLSRFLDEEEELLPLGTRMKAKNYWAFVLPALVRHRAMSELLWEYGILMKKQPGIYDDISEFVIKKITVRQMTEKAVLIQAGNQMQEEYLKNWDENKVYDEAVKEEIEKRFSFAYPYKYLEDIPVKVSVSDLKKRSWHDESELEENISVSAEAQEEEQEAPVPAFMAEKQEEYKGAARGTAYHRVMECLDYAEADTEEQLRAQLKRLLESQKMTEQEAECIRIRDIRRFVESGLGQRMKKAAMKKHLYREQPFVIQRSASMLDDGWKNETVLVQGIIDAYFMEGDEIVLVDYKTDRVKRGQEQKLIDLYHVQLEDYARALERMTGKRVKEKIIYSFTLQKEILL